MTSCAILLCSYENEEKSIRISNQKYEKYEIRKNVIWISLSTLNAEKVLKYVCGPLKKALKILLKNKEKNTSDEGVQLQEMMRVDFYTHVRESLLCICCCWWSSSLLLKVALIFDWRHFFIHHGYYFTGCPDKFWIRKLRNKTIFKSSKSLILVQ